MKRRFFFTITAAVLAAAILFTGSPEGAAQDLQCPEAQHAFATRDYAAARDGFTACIEGGRADLLPHLYHRRGRSHMKLGDYDVALADYDRALALDETHAQSLNSRAWTLLLKGLPEAGLADAEAAKGLAPEDARIVDTYAHILAALGREEEALAAFDRTLTLQNTRQITKLQDNLRALGYDPGPSDGVASPRTRAAIEACVRDRCIIWQ